MKCTQQNIPCIPLGAIWLSLRPHSLRNPMATSTLSSVGFSNNNVSISKAISSWTYQIMWSCLITPFIPPEARHTIYINALQSRAQTNVRIFECSFIYVTFISRFCFQAFINCIYAWFMCKVYTKSHLLL